ncbi:MAG: bifunctional methylenetetrahydrofolate dehydrogenase/methenyltetrahydrofolate cyclohydrolase FolD [Candidatus Fermentibacteria bacterium]|nr:bifunctional methylenetetrahydrofolate dehydrogenase/methenyltetrahydrofolate cyclohydrolase FolD [Candidatus Fermentibacteria bacterium]
MSHSGLVLSGRKYARVVRSSLKERVGALQGPPPGLAVIMVGDDSASKVYVGAKEKACKRVGINSSVINMPADSSEADVLRFVDELNSDDKIHGILVQLPLPDHISVDRIASAVLPEKDVDGFHPVNVGRLWRGEDGLFPCTPSGIVGLLRHYDITMSGKNALIVGRSNIVGKPMAALLLRENCTVTVAHSRTVDLMKQCGQADILVVAVGRAEMIKKDWVKPGAVVVDVGMNRNSSGKLVGDVDYHDVMEVCSAITPVPGGVGPLTIAYLLENTFKARSRQKTTTEPN